jgi:predicted transglutaminase-like cysteine proteinase
MADAGRVHLKRLAVIGLIVCAAGHLWQRSVLSQSQPPIVFDVGKSQLAAMVDAPPSGQTGQMFAAEFRPARPPFGMDTEPDFGGLASKWRAVRLKIDQEEKVLADCRVQAPCPAAAEVLFRIISAGHGQTGRARVGLVNRAVNLAIGLKSDEAHWGVEDYWNSPLETLRSGRGDCEDYAIVKYVALRAAGLARGDVKMVILRNSFPNEYHAVAVVRVNNEWLILDNRSLALVRDTMISATPEFLFDEDGMHRFVSPSHALPRSAHLTGSRRLSVL